MDFLTIIITGITILFIGYILSKPFVKTETQKEDTALVDDVEDRYQTLLQEIKALQEENAQDGSTSERLNQIEEKKRQAAELLRQKDPAP